MKFHKLRKVKDVNDLIVQMLIVNGVIDFNDVNCVNDFASSNGVNDIIDVNYLNVKWGFRGI